MIPGGDISGEAGRTARSFVDALKEQPLSLALVVMNFALVAFLFYSGAQQLAQRQWTTDNIINWQKGTDALMANCVSMEVNKLMLDNMQKITQTMLDTAQRDLERMQKAIDLERDQNRKLVDDAMKRLQRYVPPPGVPFPPSRQVDAPNICDPAAPFCMPE
jgi:hypothetical protein